MYSLRICNKCKIILKLENIIRSTVYKLYCLYKNVLLCISLLLKVTTMYNDSYSTTPEVSNLFKERAPEMEYFLAKASLQN